MEATNKQPHRHDWRPFQKARKFVRNLALKSIEEWKSWARSDERPIDIPIVPIAVYKHKGWISWGDWLGTGRIASFKRVYRTFDEAHSFVQGLGLKNQADWRKWAKSAERPSDIPSDPARVYMHRGWVNVGDWLGTGQVASQNMVYRPYELAQDFVRTLGLKNQDEWKKWVKSEARPSDLPAWPDGVYKNKGWVNWADWLGTKNKKGGNRAFKDARAFAHSLKIRTREEWGKWSKSNDRPSDIPANPAGVYKRNGWAGWGDWLGTGAIAPIKKEFLPFEESRAFARSLKLKSISEWHKWAKTRERPDNIPNNAARTYKDQGWIDWGDWLGTDTIANYNRNFLPFEKAQKHVHKLNLKNKNEWSSWSKSRLKPNNIPTNPAKVYKDSGWKGWGNWLGTGRIANQDRTFRSFEEARSFVRKLSLRNMDEWKGWAKSKERPDDVPAWPDGVYKDKGWINWGDWLGTGRIANQDKVYRPFEEARAFVQSLGLKDQATWIAWKQSGARPDDIPSNPDKVYKGVGWKGIGDWLGTGRIANQDRVYRQFEAARAYVRNLMLQSRSDWVNYCKSGAIPYDIPFAPEHIYKDKGWLGWGDWLGVFNRWNQTAILSFLYSIKPILSNLQPPELYAIMRQNGMLVAIKESTNSNAPLIRNIRDLCSSPNPEADFEKLISEIEKQNQAFDEEISEEALEIIPSAEETKEELPELRSYTSLKAVDALVEAGITADEETIEFLVANRVSDLWQDVLNKNLAAELENLRNDTGGVYFNTIRSRFLTQYDGAQSLVIPVGYDFRVEGKLAQPNLMQRLAAYRILTEKRLGNWSGVGAGKTLSAILTSRVVDARLTIIVAFNSTIEPWAERIQETYPDSDIIVKERGNIRVDQNKHTYLILNFEAFQQPYAVTMVQNLIEKHKIDFIVLDEIQSVKQRTPKITSKRRQVVSGLLSAAREKNPDLCVLGMSATPVINNLYEAKALLELVKGVEFNDLNTFSSIANASAMHEKLILYGIRYRPEYKQTIETEFKEIAGNEYLSRLGKVRKGAILDLEKVLLDAKLETIISSLRKGTLIYTHYLTGLVRPLRRAIEKAGFKVGLFTGEDKSGLDLFKKGKVDVLIGSVPVGTGVDGLQYICNRMIVVSLPWTSAEYEQLIGRLYRQGSAFDKVEVIIPQVVLEHNGDVWSWDKMRMHRIQYKKTLADAALDGVIPQGELASAETMFKQAREALQAWITRVENEGVTFVERSQLRVPLPKETTQIIQRRFGDLSVMNSRFNTAYSKTTHARLNENPEEWYLYHTLYSEARKSWTEIPFERIAISLKKRPDWVIGDFGCGEARLAEILSNKVYSFDHVAINENVTACDMTQTPLEDATLDIAVFSLSLMGLNYSEYLKEAHRTLKFGGMLKIAEPINRWQDKREELLSNITNSGFLLIGEVVESNHFLYIDAIKTEA
jgi:superfamily II DNA or RNA helicase